MIDEVYPVFTTTNKRFKIEMVAEGQAGALFVHLFHLCEINLCENLTLGYGLYQSMAQSHDFNTVTTELHQRRDVQSQLFLLKPWVPSIFLFLMEFCLPFKILVGFGGHGF